MIPAFEDGASSLVVGRYPTTMEEVRERFVTDYRFAGSTTRASIWDEWEQATAVLREAVPVAQVWLAGSFTTTKLDPNDIDCLYWLNTDLVSAAMSDDAAKNVIGLFAQPNALRQQFGLRIDSYVATWRSIPDPALGDHLDWKYYRDRGHWDDWWQRQRSGPKGAPPGRADSIQRRGYLEVTLDGFSD